MRFVALQDAIIARRKGITSVDVATRPENSPTYEHQYNVDIEHAVQYIKGIVCTVKRFLETKLGFILNFDHPIIA